MKHTVKQVPVKDLKPSKKNSRKHSADQVEQIAASMRQFGFTNPLLIDDDGVIIAGHGRLKAAKKLKLKTVPCLVASHMSAEEKRAYMIADNKLGEMSEWNPTVLGRELDWLAKNTDGLGDELAALFDFGGFVSHKVMQRRLKTLKDHPRNYRTHPEDQLDHLCASVEQHGIYRNIIATKDGTILAGHGVAAACRRLKIEFVPVLQLDIDPNGPQALKLLTTDNEVGHLGEADDRALTNVLKEILETGDLLGTGYDEQMLAALLMVTRSSKEIAGFDEAAEWVGMPEFEKGEEEVRLTMKFRNEVDRQAFKDLHDLLVINTENNVWTAWHPAKERDDRGSVEFEG